MTIYWVSFRIAEVGRDRDRYDALNETIQGFATPNQWWTETTSFYVFQSDASTDAIASALRGAISPAHDLVVLGSFDKKICRVIGANTDDDIYSLVDFAKRA